MYDVHYNSGVLGHFLGVIGLFLTLHVHRFSVKFSYHCCAF